MRHAIAFTLLLMLVVACGQKEEVATTQQPTPAPAVKSASLSPEEMGELGAQITKQPERANELLAHHGLTAETFEKEIRRITENPEASRKYAAAFKRTKA